MTKILTLALVSLFAVSCTKKKDSNLDLVTYNLKIEAQDKKVDAKEKAQNEAQGESNGDSQEKAMSKDNLGEVASSGIPEDIKNLINKINAGEQVSFKHITELYLQDHALGSNHVQTQVTEKDGTTSVVSTNFRDITQSLQGFINGLSAVTPKKYLNQKSAYEQKIETQSGKSILYNDKAVTLVDVQKDTKLQCFSGTALNLAVSRTVYSGQEYRNQNLVVVFTDGHVQPGQMIKIQDEWNLVTVETTQSGDAVEFLGSAKTLYGMVVVDAELFVLSEIFKNSLTPAQNASLKEQILTQTAQKYGIPLDNMKRLLSGQSSSYSYSHTTGTEDEQEDGSSRNQLAPFNSSSFGFGKPRTQPGDQERAQGAGSADEFYEIIHQLQNMTPEQKRMSNVIKNVEEMSCYQFIEKFYDRSRQFNPDLKRFEGGSCISNKTPSNNRVITMCFRHGYYSQWADCTVRYAGESNIPGYWVHKFILRAEQENTEIEFNVFHGDIFEYHGGY